MSQAAYIRDMMAEPAPDQITGPGEVAAFYAGRNVLLTGGFGFLGRLLIDRLLRLRKDINTLFLLLRAKKGKSSEERFAELFDDAIFERLKREKPGFARKIVLIDGDIAQIGLGLSSENRELLRSTDIVIHSEATVRFDEKLRVAVNINVRGTRELLLLAHDMPNLKAFVHISTAYSNCVDEVIEEEFYPPPIDTEKLLSLLDPLDDAMLDHMTPVLLGKWPNTYAFTKAIAEDTVRRNYPRIPICIVRPSTVMATAKEPVAGWINNAYGVTGVVVGAGMGLLHTANCAPDMVADLIPADYVVNNIIVAGWAVAKTQSINVNNADCSMVPEIEEPVIYNVVSSCQRPTTWRQFVKNCERYGLDIPSINNLWCYFFRLNEHLWVHKIYSLFLHLIPAIIVDCVARLTGQKPQLWDTYKKFDKHQSVVAYFALNQWRFHNNNALELWKKLSPPDRSQFDLDIGSLNWEDYSYHYVRGLRVYLVKDPLDTLPQARARYARLKVAHYTLISAFCGLILWLLLIFLRFIGLW